MSTGAFRSFSYHGGAWLVLALILSLSAAAWADGEEGSAAAPDLSGVWGSKYGDIRITQSGATIRGVLLKSSGLCPFKEGETLLDGSVMEDSIAGSLLMCQATADCGPPVKAHVVLLVARDAQVLSGSAHSGQALCPLLGFSRSGESEQGIYLTRQLSRHHAPDPATPAPALPDAKVTTPPEAVPAAPPLAPTVMPGPAAAPGSYDPRRWNSPSSETRRLLLEGKQLLNAGRFEQARQNFEQVLEQDPEDPVALVGVGVSWYGRKDYGKALDAYKRAIAADPNFGMAYYNTACIYALQGKTDLALRWLKIAFMNGFVPIEAMKEDPDLKSLHAHPEYRKLIGGEF